MKITVITGSPRKKATPTAARKLPPLPTSSERDTDRFIHRDS